MYVGICILGINVHNTPVISRLSINLRNNIMLKMMQLLSRYLYSSARKWKQMSLHFWWLCKTKIFFNHLFIFGENWDTIVIDKHTAVKSEVATFGWAMFPTECLGKFDPGYLCVQHTFHVTELAYVTMHLKKKNIKVKE